MSDFKIGVILDSFRRDFKTNAELAHSVGADGVQMYMVGGELAPDNMTPSKIREVLRILGDNALEVSAVCGDLGGHGFAKAEENPGKIAVSKKIMDAACEIGAPVVTTHIGVIPADSACDRYKIMQEACFELGSYAQQKGMHFAVETGPEKAVVLKSFLDSLSCSGMAVNLDPANFVMVTGQDPTEAVGILKDYIVHTHAKDGVMLKQTDPMNIYGHFDSISVNDYFLETPLGQGQVDFDSYLAALSDIGYHGYLTIEREVGEDPAADIRLAVNLLHSKINTD